MNRMSVFSLICGSVLLTGCATSKVAQVGDAPRAAISRAATARYPGNPQKSDRVQAAAVAHPDAKQLEILNLSDRSIPSATVWVNGSFLAQINGVGPKASVIVKYSDLLEAGDAVRDLKQLDQPVSRVELQTSEGLFTVQGPAIQ